jgi:hypothetical protein
LTVTQIKQALGSFEVKLQPTVPKEILSALKYLGHVAIVEGRLDPKQYGDNLLDSARYVGVYRNRVNDVDNRTHNVVGSYLLRGVGMAFWLGDEDGKGHVLEAPGETFSSSTFANTIRELLPPSVTEGTLHTVAGTYTGKHVWQSRRQAITYVCETFGAEWRVNNDASVDAGEVDQLYDTTPTAMLVKNQYGRDLDYAAYEGKIDSAEDVEDFSTRVVLLANGEGDDIATGDADINPSLNPYKDLLGGSVVLTRLVSESTTATTNADVRAALALSEFDSTRRSIRLATSDFSVAGTLGIGEYIHVFDPDTGLQNPANEIYFRGKRIYPQQFRCVELTWPIVEGMTVAYRDPDGVWYDLTDWVNFEEGDVAITIGELPRSLQGGWGEPIGTRPSDDGSIPAAPTWDLPFQTGAYLDGMGNTRAQVLLSWNLPLNTDGSTILDGDHYEINFGLNPATEWQVAFAAWGSLTTLISDLGPGLTYDIRIRAVDKYGHMSAWSAVEAITVAPDTIAPSTPSAPTVAGNPVSIQVKHNLGKASGGTFNLEIDLDHLEVHLGTTNTFTPGSSTIVGKMSANYGMMLGLISAVETFTTPETALRWIRVIAVDHSGNKSSPSTAASVTASLISDAYISDLTVTKVTAGTISANWLLGASIRTAASGARVEMHATGIQMFNSGGVELIRIATNGVFFLRSATSGARFDMSTISGFQAYNSGGTRTVWLDVDGSFELRSAASGARIHMDGTGFFAYNSSSQQTVNIASSTGEATFVGQISTGFSGKRIIFNPSGATNPVIRFMPAVGSSFAKIEATTDNSTDYIGMVMQSSTWSNGNSLLHLFPNASLLQTITNLPNGGPGGELFIHSGEVSLVRRTNGGGAHGITIDDSGVYIMGAPYKSFIIDHPTDADRYLVHACTESPAPGVEYWGEAILDERGQAVVELPDYFEALTLPDGRYVAVNTCSDEIRNASATYPTDGRFTIHGGPGLRVTWLVKAIRADAAPMLIEPRRDQIDVYGDGPYRYYNLKEPQRG